MSAETILLCWKELWIGLKDVAVLFSYLNKSNQIWKKLTDMKNRLDNNNTELKYAVKADTMEPMDACTF